MPYSGLNTTFYQSYCHLKWQWPITYHMWHIEYKVTWHKILSFTFDLLYFTLLQNRTERLSSEEDWWEKHFIVLALICSHFTLLRVIHSLQEMKVAHHVQHTSLLRYMFLKIILLSRTCFWFGLIPEVQSWMMNGDLLKFCRSGFQ